MKKSLYLALTFCILFFAFSFSVNAVKNETFNTVDGEVVSIYSEEYEVTVNIFGRPICMNTQGTLYNIFNGDIDKIDNIKVNFIDIDGNTAETVANFKNSELFEEFTSNNISFCYAPNEYGNNVMWRLLRNFGSDTNSVALPTTIYINSEGEILEVSSGVQGKEDILRVLNSENSFNEKVGFSVKGKANYDYAYEVLNLLNELRSSIGLSTLAMNKELLDVAMQRAAEISVYYSHTRPDGTNCTTAFPVQYGALAENIAMGQISPSEVMYDWTNSPGHFSNMTWNGLNSVGIGVFEDADGNMYWVQFFYSGESDHYVKSGVEEKTFQITATLSNLNISCYLQGEKDQIYLEKGDKTNVIISNSESGSDFQVKSENEDLLYIDENGVATVKGETPFDVKLKVFYCVNPDISFDVTLTIGHEHNYSSYSTGQNYKCGVEKKLYQYVCVLCEHTYEEEITTGSHKFSESDITVEPTCTTAGTTTFTCICGDTYTEAIPAINHANATTDAGKEPTETEVGYTAGKYCPDCETWLEGHEEIPMLHTHTYTSTVTKEATCWREGETTYTCSCGDTYTEAIAKLDHEYRPWETKKNPTCTAPGLEWSYCLLCDNDFEREIPATGHTIIDYTRRATPDSDGAYVTACDVCNEVFKSISFGRPTKYKLSTTKYTYDGKTKTPKLTVETSDGVVLKEGVDYELELPSGRKAVGVYTYRVVFKGNFLGEKKVSYQILPGKTTSVSATQSTDSIKLTWKKVTGATGYRVYQYNSKTGKYEKIKTLTGTSYTVKKLKAGTTYKFAVKAYSKADGETLWASSYKTITTATKPATPTLKATAGSKQATISWKKVTGATGYVVYMQDEFGDYEKIGTTKNTSYTRKKLTKGETYYFRVRAYKTVDGKNIYGGYKTVKVKVK